MHRFTYRWTGLPLACLILIQSLVSTPVFGLSGGPTQPEFGQPSVVGSDDMVDVFTGNFKYSIPLFEIGGYPITLSYTSDHKMEEEASWVGFGWTLNPGAISRQVRGLPDDFNGDMIVKRGNMKPNITTGISPGADVELFGRFGLSAAFNFNFNNYTGFSFSKDYSPSVNVMKIIAGGGDSNAGSNESVAAGESKFKIKAPQGLADAQFLKVAGGANFNSRSGLESASFSSSHNLLSNVVTFRNGGITYTPTADLPYLTKAATYTFKVGGKFGLPDGQHLVLRGQRITQSLAVKSMQQPTYGYLYADGAADDPRAVMDYNSEQAGVLNQDAVRLPLAYGTPDVFSVTGPGISGQLEVARRNVQPFRPAATTSVSTSNQIGGDLALGNLAHFGPNLHSVRTVSTKGGWTDLVSGDDPALPVTTYQNTNDTRQAYFRFVSLPGTQTTQSSFADLGKNDPVEFTVTRTGSNKFRPWPLPNLGLNNSNKKPTEIQRPRTPNATVVNYFTLGEMMSAGLDQAFERFSLLEEADTDYSNFENITTGAPWEHFPEDTQPQSHHLGRLDLINAGGQRYVYGLPVYNISKREVTFNTADHNRGLGEEGKTAYGTIDYTGKEGELISIGNDSGTDHYYNEVVTGPYPVAHLLTSVLSPDYVDRTLDGPSTDDLGNYVKFAYSPLMKDATTMAGAGYRTPMGVNTAVLNRGNLSDEGDDKASFTAGSKEIYYVHHIDSKTHRAVFITSPRHDAIPVDEHGHNQAFALRKLDAIKVYTLAELSKNGAAAVPVKTVHFNYSEGGVDEISANLPNAEGYRVVPTKEDMGRGKLTLISVSFTYGSNLRGLTNPYRFTYKTTVKDEKIKYEPFMVDRWGTQKPTTSTPELTALEYPFSVQDEELAAEYSALGNLTDIRLPSGGEIAIDYEADSYAYVQDHRAGRMFALAGFSEEYDPDFSIAQPGQTTDLYTANLRLGIPHLYTYIKVDKDIEPWQPDHEGNWTQGELKRRFLEQVDQLYFSALVKITEKDERVTGYAGFDPTFIKLIEQEEANYLVLKMNGLNVRNRETNRRSSIHPIAYAAVEKLRAQLPRQVYDMSDGDKIDVYALAATLYQSAKLFQNFFGWRLSLPVQNAQKIKPQASYVRLADPTFTKYGGGSRVRSIILTDNWLAAAEDERGPQDASHSYTKEYMYTTTDPTTGRTISSGVAANEPLNGKEELLFVNVGKKPLPLFLAPDQTYYYENPAGLHFYPGASVGYSEVRMRIILDENVHQSKPGTTIHRFYTARDFPVKVSYTRLDPQTIEPKPENLMVYSRYLQRLAMSQGFAIEVNDMHGKARETEELNHDSICISRTTYHYRQTEPNQAGKASLDNLVEQVSATPGGTPGDATQLIVKKDLLGVHTSTWIAHQEDNTTTKGGGLSLNIELSLLGGAFFPLPVAATVPWPNITASESSINTVSVTKLVSRMGILKEVEVMNNGSTLSTKNLRFDALTASPVLTSTQNEFDQPIYQNNSPAYWMTPQRGMGPAYATSGERLENVQITDGKLVSHPQFLLSPGDELMVFNESSTTPSYLRATAVPDQKSGTVVLINDRGTKISVTALGQQAYVALRVRSGYRNMLSATSGQTTALEQPNQVLSYSSNNRNVLNTSVSVYSDAWGNLCTPIGPPVDPCDECDKCQPCPDCPTWEEPSCEECPNYPGCPSLCSRPSNCQNSVSVGTPILRKNEYDQCVVIADQDYTALYVKGDLPDDCDACWEIFDKFMASGWFPEPQDYTKCGTATGNYEVTEQGCKLINACDFLRPVYGMSKVFSGKPVLLSDIIEQQSEGCQKPGAINPNCDNVPTYLPPPSEFSLGTLGTFNPENSPQDAVTLSSVSDLSAESCFPWHEEAGINPYLDGRRGNWRLQSSFVPKQSRRLYATAKPDPSKADERDNDYSQPLVYQDGTLESYQPFWFDQAKFPPLAYYERVSQVNRYDEHGHEIETQDALKIKSGAQYGFLQNLPVAVAQNASHLDIGFDGFEDYAYERSEQSADDFWKRHFGALGRSISTPDNGITDAYAHTGRYSLALASGQSSQKVTYSTLRCDSTAVFCPDEDGCGDCINGFTPSPGGDYLVSVWVANRNSLSTGRQPNETSSREQSSTTNAPHLTLTTNDGNSESILAILYPTGVVVEGWQQMQLRVEVPEDAHSLSLQLKAPTSGSGEYFFDDVRIQPFASEMTAYVYDYRTLRLMAQLDDRGYAVFYEYDDEGMLIRQKRETQRGIVTITEQHTNLASPATPQKP